MEIDLEFRGSYIFLDKRYVVIKGKYRDVEKRRKIVKERGKGWSYIEVDG